MWLLLLQPYPLVCYWRENAPITEVKASVKASFHVPSTSDSVVSCDLSENVTKTTKELLGMLGKFCEAFGQGVRIANLTHTVFY